MILTVAAVTGCGPRAGSPAGALATTEARGGDILGPTPDLVVVLRPRALRHDTVYGPLLRRVIELARERSPIVARARALDVVEDADEVTISVRDDGATSSTERLDLVVALRGVRADLDPLQLVDEDGRALWSPGPGGGVRELTRAGEASAEGASLFELPDRTWIIAFGDARTRTRRTLEAGVHPIPAPIADAEAVASPAPAGAILAEARLRGPALVSRVRALRPPSLLAPVGRSLETAAVTLSPGVDGIVRLTLTYADAGAAAPAAATLRETLAALSSWRPEEYAWLRSATIAQGPGELSVRVPLPGAFLTALLLPAARQPVPH